MTGAVKFFGPHHFLRCSGSVHAFQASSRGASWRSAGPLGGRPEHACLEHKRSTYHPVGPARCAWDAKRRMRLRIAAADSDLGRSPPDRRAPLPCAKPARQHPRPHVDHAPASCTVPPWHRPDSPCRAAARLVSTDAVRRVRVRVGCETRPGPSSWLDWSRSRQPRPARTGRHSPASLHAHAPGLHQR